MSEQKRYGGISFDGKDIAIPEVPFDKIAVDGRGQLLLLSICTDQIRIKAIRAILCGGAKAMANAGGVKVNQPGVEAWRAHSPGRLCLTADGYSVFTHKLGYGMAQALFITRMPGFMKVVTPESLWQELNTSRFTTPILRAWIPYIEKTLRDEERLEDAYVFNCACGVLTASTKSLDEIISDGLKSGAILIPRESHVA